MRPALISDLVRAAGVSPPVEQIFLYDPEVCNSWMLEAVQHLAR